MRRALGNGARARPWAAVILSATIGTALVGCDLPGKPTPEDRPVIATQVTDFTALYSANCSGCHGTDGRLGAARPLNDPLYLALVNPDVIRSVITAGVAGTAQPALAQSAGGTLTDEQIGILSTGVATQWRQPDLFKNVTLPPYSLADAQHAGSGNADAERGATVYRAYCARCHGDTGTGGAKGGSIVDPSYLALVSDQALRTTVIAGRIDLGMPDFRNDVSGQPMSPQQITDVVAWLTSHRVRFPGQPYARKETR
jgi:mono/diheme cytochrome c family protein